MWNRIASWFGGGAGQLDSKQLERTFEQAVQLLQQGDGLKAEELVHAASEQAAAQAGRDSQLYAQALFHEATILCGVNDLVRAAVVCRTAAEVPAKDKAGQKDRLTYWMNLGDILTRLNQLEEAEQVLRQSLEERDAFYGVEHSGYAFGLAPLADNLFAQGRAAEALPLARQAVEINWKNGNEQAASDLALLACVVKAAEGPDAPGLELWEALPPHMQQKLVEHCLERAERSDPSAAKAMLVELRRRLQSTPDVEVAPLINVNVQLANIARLAGDHETRIEAARFSIKLCGGAGDISRVVNAYEGLAMALDDAGRFEECEQAYRDALAKARQGRQRRLASNVLRNYAIWLDQRDRKDDARRTHQEAVAEAAASGDGVMRGRALAASGIFLQHSGQPGVALAQLQESLQLLPPDHADAFCAQSHVLAIEAGGECSCGQTGDEAVSKLALRMIRAKVGDGLLKALQITLAEEGPQVKVELTREPQPQEIEHLNRVISQTVAQMRTSYQRRGFAAD